MKIRNISEALLPREKVPYYVDRIIRPASLNQFYAEPGTGKSLAFMTLGICFSTPHITDWLGFNLSNKGKVLFVQEEMGDEGFIEFLAETYRGFFGGKKYEIPFDFTVFEHLNFSDMKSVTKLMKEVKDNEYKLIFIDSFAATTNDNEDKKEDMQPIMNRARLVTSLPSKPALIFTHHPTKSNGNYRGSGAIKAALDLLISVRSTSPNTIEFKMEKNRYRPCISWEAKKVFDKDIHGNDTFMLERTGKPSDLKERQELMISIIENNPEYGQQQLIEAYVRLGGKKVDTLPILKTLDDNEITEIVSESIGGRGQKKVRKLSEAYIAERMAESVQDAISTFSNNGHHKK